MRLIRLTVSGVRNLQPLDLRPSPGLNLIIGANGAGKTSLLEAIHLLAYGRSFRGRVRDGLVQTGATQVEIFAEWEGGSGRVRKAGLQHEGKSWRGRLDGQDVQQLGALCGPFAALTFEPGSHALLNGGAESRRRYLDWGLFHVERGDGPETFHTCWRRYARALKQRNTLLKQRAPAPQQLDAWEAELAGTGELLDLQRRTYLERLQPRFRKRVMELLPQLGEGNLSYRSGWRRDQLSLADALLLARERDLATGYTSVGPHRADWSAHHAGRPDEETLSRGQAKLTALACLLSQGEDFAAERGHWPLVLLDDLAAELDQEHQRQLVLQLQASGAQVFISGTHMPPALHGQESTTVFHVEQGHVRRN